MTNTADFLPENYEQPTTGGNYMKLQKGENKFRILSKPIIGWVDWKEKKPIRFQMNNKPERPIDPKKPIKHFWAFIVWNYQEAQIQILEIIQSSIQTAITTLIKDNEWGSPYGYDIKIIRSGEGMETEYKVNPSPHKPLTPEMQKSFADKPCNLDAMFEGEDPWQASDKVTPIESLPF